HHVQHDQRRRVPLEQPLRLVAAGGLERPITVALEVAYDHVAHDRLIIDHKDRGHIRIVSNRDCVNLKSSRHRYLIRANREIKRNSVPPEAMRQGLDAGLAQELVGNTLARRIPLRHAHSPSRPSASRPSFSRSATRSIDTIRARALVNPTTAIGLPPGATTSPALPFTTAGRANRAKGR